MRLFANAFRAARPLGWLLGSLTALSLVHAVTPESTEGTTSAPPPSNPYLTLTNRNAFGIKPPPAPPDPKANTPPPAPPNLFVTGFSRLKGVKRAYLVVNRPGKSPDYLVVDEAYDVDGLKVTSIDPGKETLTVINGGTEVSLNFKDNGLKAANLPPGPVNNPGVVQPVGGPAAGTARPPTQVFPPGSPGAPTVIRRSSMDSPGISDAGEDAVPTRSARRGGVYLGNSAGGGLPGGVSATQTTVPDPSAPLLPPPSASSVPAAPGIIANPGSGRQPPPVPYLGK
jgi:hypothetical protein